jgi:nucleoside-diphosphate-sugar epimerase
VRRGPAFGSIRVLSNGVGVQLKVFVIGGSGLISSAVRAEFLERGHEVVLFNRGLSPLRGPRPSRVIHGDRNDETALRAALRAEKPDAVVDMVAFGPAQAEALLRAAEGQTPQLLVCSTVCVYGGPLTRLPATEDEPHRPVTAYGRDKSALEALILARGGAGQSGTIIRPSHSTGEGEIACGLLFDDGTVDRLRKGLPVVVMEDGSIPWAIAHVSDVARAFAAALGNPGARGQAYQATSDEHTDWNGVYTAMAQAAGAPPPDLVGIPCDWLQRNAPRRSLGVQTVYKYPSIFDNGKAARELGWRSEVGLVETFRRQIAWMDAEGKGLAAELDPTQDELAAAWRAGRDADPGSFVDRNPWGNGSAE